MSPKTVVYCGLPENYQGLLENHDHITENPLRNGIFRGIVVAFAITIACKGRAPDHRWT